MLYNELGESTPRNSFVLDDETWVEERKRASTKAQEELASRSEVLRDRQRELSLHKVNGVLVDVLYAPARAEVRRRANEKARLDAAKKACLLPPAKRSKAFFNPEEYIGKRVAKNFRVEDENDPNVLVDMTYFGTVANVSDSKRVWFFIKYDDGDDEEYNSDELQEALQLYEEHESEDTNKSDATGHVALETTH
jgi:hypothetical protein